MGFYSLNPLSPGGWTELLDEAGPAASAATTE